MSTDSAPGVDGRAPRLNRKSRIYMRTFQIVGFAGGLVFLWLALTFFDRGWQVVVGFTGVAVFCLCWGVALTHYFKGNRTSGRRWGSVGFCALGVVILGLTVVVDDGGAGFTTKRLIVQLAAALMIAWPLYVFSRPLLTNP